MITQLLKGSTQPLPFLLTDAATGQTGQTGKSGAAVGTHVACSGSGVAGSLTLLTQVTTSAGVTGGYAPAGGSVAEAGNGNYDYFPSATETAATGLLRLNVTCGGCQTEDEVAQITAYDPNLPLATGDASGRAILAPTGLDVVSIADVTGDTDARSTLPKMLRALFNRHFNKVTATATQMQVFNDANTATNTLTVSDDGTTATKGKSA